jgi:hypothetical protein
MELEYQRQPKAWYKLTVSVPLVEWCHDPDAPFEIEARLERNGFDQATINAKVFLQAKGSFMRQFGAWRRGAANN